MPPDERPLSQLARFSPMAPEKSRSGRSQDAFASESSKYHLIQAVLKECQRSDNMYGNVDLCGQLCGGPV
jgi:hypothetical protein